MRTLIALLLALAAIAQVPARALAADTPDELLRQLEAADKQEADAAKLKAEIKAKLRAYHAELTDKLTRAGVLGPLPPAPPPKPVDPLKEKLAAAFKGDLGEHADALQLAALYREAGKLAGDPAVPSSRELLRRVREASTALVGADVLVGVRTVVAGELAAVLGAPSDTPLTDAQRAAAADLFRRLATILEGF